MFNQYTFSNPYLAAPAYDMLGKIGAAQAGAAGTAAAADSQA